MRRFNFMKVLHLISGGDTGGAKTHIINLCTNLKNFIGLKIICFMYGQFYEEVKKSGIDIDVYEQRSRFDLSVIDKIVQLVYSQNFDIIHCHGARANFIGMLLKKKIKDKPFLTTIHSDFDLDFQDVVYKKIIFSYLNKISLKKFDYFIVVSSLLKDKVKKLGISNNRVFVLHNGFDFDKKISFEGREDFLSKYIDKSLIQSKIVIGNLCRLIKVKGLDVFIKAAELIVKEYDDVIFLIGGDGPQKEYLENLINELKLNNKVFLLGKIDNPYDFFNAIDINVISSYSEGFPYSLLEATMLEKCCVSSRVGSIPDLIEDEKNGLFFEAGNHKELSQKIKKLLDDKALIQSLGRKLSQKAKEKFSAKSMAETQFRIYEKILSKK